MSCYMLHVCDTTDSSGNTQCNIIYIIVGICWHPEGFEGGNFLLLVIHSLLNVIK